MLFSALLLLFVVKLNGLSPVIAADDTEVVLLFAACLVVLTTLN